MPEITKQSLVEHAIGASQEIAADFTKPDDDFDPIAMVSNGEELQIVLLKVDKPLWAKALVEVAKRTNGANTVVVVNSVYMYGRKGMSREEIRAMTEEFGGTISKIPGRKEALIVGAMDASGMELHVADITRFEDKPPELGEFSTIESEDAYLWQPILDYLKEHG